MKLIETVKVSDNQTMGIYELSEDGAKKHGKRYMLTCGIFNDYYLSRHGEEETISNLRDYYYEGLFETRLEAYLTAKLVAASSELSRLSHVINDFQSIRVNDITW